MTVTMTMTMSLTLPLPCIHKLFHKRDIIIFGHLAILLQIRSAVFRHALDKVVNELVWDERVSEVQLCHVWLWKGMSVDCQ